MSQTPRASILRLGAAAVPLFVAALLVSSDGGRPSGLQAQAPDPCASPVTNPVACENTLPGNPASEWDVTGAGSSAIQGFATDISVNRGQTVHFKVDTAAVNYRIDIYRLGYYGGAGARKVATVTPSVTLPQAQPACLADNSTGLLDCGNWSESASWAVPATAVSGIYIAKLVRTDGVDGDSHIVFVVRDDTGHSDLLFQTSDTTWQAYNSYGGNSLYAGQPAGRAYKVSYNRPFTTRANAPEDWLFNAEYPMVRWLESNGYNVSYTTGIDTDRRGAELLEHKVFLSVGHDEYWSGVQRANAEAARNAGVHLAFFSGNEVFWKTRYEPSIDGSSSAYRTLVCYKETHANGKIDPLADVWTGTWRDPRFSPPADGGRPENALTGTIFTVNAPASTADAIRVPEALGKLRLWRNTSVASLAAGTTATLAAGTLGYEWDEALTNGAQPNGLMRLSSATYTSPSKLQDYGSTFAPGSATHAITLYRHSAANALVFGAGTVQWSWGLDGNHDRGGSVADVRMQQATVNLFADMGVQPFALTGGLTVASASSDTTAPAITLSSPASGATVLQGVPTTISGTASDAGGIVAAVEVSTDGGATWKTATGTTSWSYLWTPSVVGPTTLSARAVDDTGNAGTSAGVTVTVSTTLPSSCPCTIWPDATVPPLADAGPDGALELGVKFRTDVDGLITGVRFYKSAANTGTHIGNLWTAGGTLLGTVVFSNESASGWQTAMFTTPIAVTANTTYVASYHMTGGHYSYAPNYFGSSGVDSGPLHALANSVSPNGVFRYGSSSTFPNLTYNAANYWVDVVFDEGAEETTPPTVTTVTPAPGSSSVGINASMTATFSEPIDTTTIGASTFTLRDSSNNAVAAVVSYDSASRTATLDPTASLAPGMTYTARVRGGSTDPRVKDVVGNALAADFVWTFSIPSDTTPPVVTTLVPAASASGVSVSTTVRATFSESMDGSTINGNTFTLRTSANALVAATVTYDAATATAILTPTAPLTPSAVFTATVKGGSTDPRVKDAAGNALSADASWSFTTQSAAPSGCPCTIWPSTATPAGIDSGDSDAVELGVKFQSDADGFITGIRFYKAASNGGTHVGHLWTSAGTLLATVTFANETASGWQQANLTTPVAITANTVYVVSYFAPQGHYSYTGANFQSAVHNPPLHALANSAGGNGVFRYGSTGFPNQSWNATNYWVDVVYGTSATGGDTTAPSVSSVSPVNGGTGIGINTTITATFSEVLDATTVSTNTLEVRNPSNALVPVSVSWDAAARMAILQPTAPLAYSTQYTVRVKGGAVDPRVKDAAGNAMASDFVWSFTTGAAAGQSPSEGPGGPVLVVTGASNPGGAYYAEILRAEGLNAFSVMDITSVTTGVLAAYDVVILSEIPLSAAQVTMFSGWAQAGGNLIAMRPDKQLAGLLGLTDLGTTLSDKYLLVDTLTGPGKGIVAETMQFHGTADRYGLNGATTVATLYSASATPTTSPAVTMRALPGGGTVAAFAYDLAKSVVYTRQGNPAWSGQDRDGQAPVRSNDLFFGASASDPQADWIDFNKVHIPQADEQQRLLANMILTMNLSRKPLPRFWYLPRGLKAAIVMTGDDHNGGGTIGRFDSEKIVSPAGCSVENWECVRSTSYIYATAPLTTAPADAAAYTLQGFDIAAHLNTQCQNFTAASLATVFTSQLTAFQSAYPGAGVPKTNRMHCIVWSDYDTLPQVSFANGIRLDTTYYYWPGTWVQNRPGLFTGSGLPMRFARANGTLVDVYQAPTQLSDESAIDYTLHTNTLLDRALGPEGFYGTFVANMHTDVTTHLGWQAIIASVQSRSVPVISAKQLLTWLDARNGSSFGQLTWTPAPVGPQGGHTLSFTLTPGANSTGLQAMLPLTLTGGAGRLVLLQRDGVGTSFEVKTVKGIQYAVFAAAAGNYSAIYDTTAPVTTFSATPSSLTNSNSATFVFSANEAGSTFECSLDAAAYASCASPQTLNGLATGAHTFAVRATDTAGNSGTASNSWTVDQAPPTISSRTPSPGATGAPLTGSVTVVFNEAVLAVSDATFQIQRVGSATPLAAIITATGNTAVLKPVAPLLIGAAYTVTVGAGVTDAAGNALGSDSVWSFTATGAIADSTAAEFTAGTVDANARITQVAGGEVVLGPSVGSEFNDAALPAGWTTTQWTTGGAASVSGGALNVNGVRTGSTATYSPGRSLEFVATFGADNYQHVGFGDTFESTPWAIFSTAGGGGLYARTHNGVNQVTTLIPGSWLGTSHRFRIDWGTSTVVYSIDGSQVASHSIAIAVNMRPIASDYITGGSSLVVDWLWLSRPYTVSAVFTSRVIDAAAPANWTSVGVTADLPSGTAIAMSVRMGNTATPDGSWTAWTTVPAGGSISGSSRYIQYRATLSTTDPNQTPTLRDVTLTGSTQ